MIRLFLLSIIRFYQYFISPLLGPHCRFIPSCSEYTYEAIQVYGSIKGLLMGLWRLAKCHPLCAGGYDPVVRTTKPETLG
jgi:uncharacterized protein